MYSKFFSNPGEKLRTLTFILFCIEVIACVLFFFLTLDDYTFIPYLILTLLALAVSYVSSLLLIAFAELVSKVSDLSACVEKLSAAKE